MGSECNPTSKHRYDITMSKRTRKPFNLPEAKVNDHTRSSQEKDQAGDSSQRRSLKQLMINGNINIEGTNNKGNPSDESKSKLRSSLGQHFSDEEKQQLQLVTKQKQEIMQGAKLKGMMGRYVKVLSHLIKAKRESSSSTRNNIGSRKKPVLRLAM
ncbi:hypothetical protein P3X46_024236 [Hevea brasiliensis]|uniref:Calmodulin-binding domain-containing protein n=1 Tax=Hevea brasiliensis TaxID=3981 RepID=A0ABQ9L563_HEVBR|nr:uncharacterized protein LOC110669348 [Hevea brasiliensis]KAJ9158672.1 hypothetical protein P3X46_024236 [Hevea brasiliensis]